MFALPKAAWYEFQSPRSWGGGLGRSDDTSTASPGGIISIPSELGRGRVIRCRRVIRCQFVFSRNPVSVRLFVIRCQFVFS